MVDRGNVLHGYRLLANNLNAMAEHLDETFDKGVEADWKEHEAKIKAIWDVIDRRKQDRRGR